MVDLEEVRQSLRKAFIEHRADFIIIDGWTHPWQSVAAAKAEELGYLTSTFHDSEEQQYSCFRFRLTDEGRKWLEEVAG